MSTSRFLERLVLGSAWIGLMIAVWAITPSLAVAQCGDYPANSTCYTCHEQTDPVFGKGEWHEIHARKDCCWNCHGGNAQAVDKDVAHLGMTLQPLKDTYADCYACHPSDYEAKADRFGAALGVIPVSQAPTPQPSFPSASGKDFRLVILLTPEPISAPVTLQYPELICLALVLVAILAFLLWNKAHHRSPFLPSK